MLILIIGIVMYDFIADSCFTVVLVSCVTSILLNFINLLNILLDHSAWAFCFNMAARKAQL